jgi:hypothetical protein
MCGNPPSSGCRLSAPWIAAIVILSAITGAIVRKLKPAETRQAIRIYYYELPESQQLSNPAFAALAVSPDGRQFAYSTTKGIFLRTVDEITAKIIPGTEENTQQPFFLPDGKWIGYLSLVNRKLKKIPIKGGAPVALCDVTQIADASWGADDRIVYAEQGKGVMRISTANGTPEALIRGENESIFHPRLLPDGKSILYTRGTNEGYKIVVQFLKSGKRNVSFPGDCACYLPTGHLVYTVGNKLFAVPFDLDRLEIGGSPVPLDEAVFRLGVYMPQYAVSDSGTLVYMPTTVPTYADSSRPQITLFFRGTGLGSLSYPSLRLLALCQSFARAGCRSCKPA